MMIDADENDDDDDDDDGGDDDDVTPLCSTDVSGSL